LALPAAPLPEVLSHTTRSDVVHEDVEANETVGPESPQTPRVATTVNPAEHPKTSRHKLLVME
jgi:hypothetical protein